MITLHMRLCRKICTPQQIRSSKEICTRYRTSPTYNLTEHRNKSTHSSPQSLSPLQYLKLQSKCHFNKRDNLLDTLLPGARSVNHDVIARDGTCSSCNKNFYNMGSISPATFRQFVEFQLDRPEHVARGYGFLRTIPRDQIRELLRKHLLVLEKLARTILQSRDIVAIVDQANINNMTHGEGRRWCAQNRDKTVEVTEFYAPHMFRVRAYDGVSRKTYAVKCKYFFQGLDDLYCLYLSLLLPHMPLVFSEDKFTNYIARANEFEAVSGERGFGGNFQKVLSNVQSSSVPNGDRDGFYFPSSSFTVHHVIEGGRSFCITNTAVRESDVR